MTVVHDLFFDHVNEVLGLAAREQRVSDRELEKGIEVRDNRVHLRASEETLHSKPYLMMRTFLAAAKTGAQVHYR